MRIITPIEKGKYYHIYNRGINGETIFKEEKNYYYFLEKWAQHVSPIADTFAYCLLKNHFHCIVRIKEEDVYISIDGREKLAEPSRQFSNFFNSYAQSINKAYERTGGLFESPFKRIEVVNENYFSRLIVYIHANPEKHGFVKDFKTYPYSSFDALLSTKASKLKREEVLNWFGGKDAYQSFHTHFKDYNSMKDLIIEEDAFL
jgi:putative transposase